MASSRSAAGFLKRNAEDTARSILTTPLSVPTEFDPAFCRGGAFMGVFFLEPRRGGGGESPKQPQLKSSKQPPAPLDGGGRAAPPPPACANAGVFVKELSGLLMTLKCKEGALICLSENKGKVREYKERKLDVQICRYSALSPACGVRRAACACFFFFLFLFFCWWGFAHSSPVCHLFRIFSGSLRCFG